MKRLNCLKRRFIRDKSFHELYKTFIHMLQKLSVRKAENEQIGKVWYIPHHEMTHQAKSGKVWVDWSAEFTRTSLNKKLTAGPDLTNQLVGVLTKFREEHTAYMADIKAMFQQVRVPENQRSLLTFLWWEHGDPRMEVEEFETCVHLSGGKSSPSCSNYALKRRRCCKNSLENFLCWWYAKVIPKCRESTRSDFQNKRIMCCWRFQLNKICQQ